MTKQQQKPLEGLIGAEVQMVVTKKLTTWGLMYYQVYETHYDCQNCGRSSCVLGKHYTAHFETPQGKKIQLSVGVFHRRLREYYGPDVDIPKAPLKVKRALMDVSACSFCVDSTFGTSDLSPLLPTLATQEVPAEDLIKPRKKSKSRSIHVKKPKVKPMGDKDFFGMFDTPT